MAVPSADHATMNGSFHEPRDVHMDWIHPWIGYDWIGLELIGSNSEKYCVDWIGLGPMTVMYKIMTVYVFFPKFPVKQTETILCNNQ